jgi:hypothetical protein
MVRLHIIVEGQTEETFVKKLLVDELALFGVYADARLVETGRKRAKVFKGGAMSYAKIRRDIERWMNSDQRSDAYFTTMFDLYALPSDFPGFDEAKKKTDPYARVGHLEEALAMDLVHPRFVPYLQLHEFEALLFAAPERFEVVFIEEQRSIDALREIQACFNSPELIDDGEDTAPSKRIISVIPKYKDQNASAGPLIASAIGLPKLKQECAHFSSWLDRLLNLSRPR